jgi:DNA-binding PadR family transcriptional regulator
MSVKYAVLGLLAEQPMHGYRLKRAFDARVSTLWGLTTAQIYQTLNALERGRLVESRAERAGSRPTRRTYSLTSAGRRAFAAWLDGRPAGWTRPFRAEMLVRLLFMRTADVSRIRRVLDEHEHEARRLRDRVARATREHSNTEIGVDVRGLFLAGTALHLDADLRIFESCRHAIESRCDVASDPARWTTRRSDADR